MLYHLPQLKLLVSISFFFIHSFLIMYMQILRVCCVPSLWPLCLYTFLLTLKKKDLVKYIESFCFLPPMSFEITIWYVHMTVIIINFQHLLIYRYQWYDLFSINDLIFHTFSFERVVYVRFVILLSIYLTSNFNYICLI